MAAQTRLQSHGAILLKVRRKTSRFEYSILLDENATVGKGIFFRKSMQGYHFSYVFSADKSIQEGY
jgi:hypothetical protein